MAIRNKAQAGAAGPPFLLEAHYYSGGLRIRPLSGGERPGWVPAKPEDYVGFRDEFGFEPEDAVLEFARFTVGGERLTWVGLFFRSVDQVFGDRRNHAGAGVWLRDARVTNLPGLLHGLRQIAEGVAREGVESVIHDAASFADQYLTSYVAPSGRLPAQLDGWRFSPTPLTATSLFAVDEPSEAEAWQLAAEQVSRMFLLPQEGMSRALILVRVSAQRREPGKGFQAVRRGLASELIGVLPQAIADIATENATLIEQARAAREASAEAETQLRTLRTDSAAARGRITELEKQIAESDILRRLASIDSKLDTIEDDGRYGRTQLATIARDLQGVRDGREARGEQPLSLPLSRSAGEQPQPGAVVGKRSWRISAKGFAVTLLAIIATGLILWAADPLGWFTVPTIPPLPDPGAGVVTPASTP